MDEKPEWLYWIGNYLKTIPKENFNRFEPPIFKMGEGEELSPWGEKIAGGIAWDVNGHIREINLPEGRNGYERAVILHELIHAHHSSPKGKDFEWRLANPQIYNAIEDVRVHTIWFPDNLPKQLKEDTIQTALSDMDDLVEHRIKIVSSRNEFNLGLQISLRSMAIARKLTRDFKIQEMVAQVFGVDMAVKLDDLVKEIQQAGNNNTKLRQVSEQFQSLMA